MTIRSTPPRLSKPVGVGWCEFPSATSTLPSTGPPRGRARAFTRSCKASIASTTSTRTVDGTIMMACSRRSPRLWCPPTSGGSKWPTPPTNRARRTLPHQEPRERSACRGRLSGVRETRRRRRRRQPHAARRTIDWTSRRRARAQPPGHQTAGSRACDRREQASHATEQRHAHCERRSQA